MAKYDKYDKYKDSGVEWLGELPSHWDVKRLGSFFEERREKVSDVDYPALSVTKSGIVPQLDTAAKTDAGDNRKLVKADDFVINSRSDRKGSSGISPYTGSVSLISIVMEPRTIYPAYAHHLLRSYPFQEEFYRYGKGIVADLWSTNSSEMKNILLPVIPITEQQNIANFLDHETAKIDSLIEKQQQLIQLLKEKRQAVISHAVTKGLNPNVPMKDSGVEWLGQVPEHWEVIKFDYVINTVSDIDHYMPNSVDVGIPYLMTGDLQDFVSDIDFESCKKVTYSDYQKLSRKIKTTKDDIIFARYATIGTLSYVDIDKEFLVSYSCVTIKPNPQRTTGKYLSYYLRSQAFLQAIQQQINSNTQGNVGVDSLRNVKILLPLLSEQEKIIDFLKAELTKMDNLIAKAQSVIQLMQERRTTLISSAVTGKIDVRNWQNPNNNNEAKTEFSA